MDLSTKSEVEHVGLSESTKRKNCFEIKLSGRRRYVLCAEDYMSMVAWIDAVKAVGHVGGAPGLRLASTQSVTTFTASGRRIRGQDVSSPRGVGDGDDSAEEDGIADDDGAGAAESKDDMPSGSGRRSTLGRRMSAPPR